MAENPEKSTPPASEAPHDQSRDKDEEGTKSATTDPKDLEDGEYEEPAQETAPGTSEPAPPLPNETAPPLPNEAPPLPSEAPPEEDDGWAPIWEESAQAFYFYNRFTQATQWDNPRVPDTSAPAPPPGLAPAPEPEEPPAPTGYNPSIHGSYDPTAWYAQPQTPAPSSASAPPSNDPYAATAAFNRFTGRFQSSELAPENFNDENKSKRQMNAFFDVDAAANSHDGRSLKAERSGKKLSKGELKGFREKRKQKKEEKRRAWLRD